MAQSIVTTVPALTVIIIVLTMLSSSHTAHTHHHITFPHCNHHTSAHTNHHSTAHTAIITPQRPMTSSYENQNNYIYDRNLDENIKKN
jgi:hypothetical protein